MLKFIILAVAAFVLYKMFVNDAKKKAKQSKKETERLKATGELVRDPACGTYVSLDSDIRVREGDTVHRFCSYECRDKYLKQLGMEPPADSTKQAGAKNEDA